MATDQQPIRVQPESELGLIVRDAVTTGPVLVEMDAALYELEVHPAAATTQTTTQGDAAGQRDSLFNIVGMSAGGEPTDIAHRKAEYLAEAYEPRSQ